MTIYRLSITLFHLQLTAQEYMGYTEPNLLVPINLSHIAELSPLKATFPVLSSAGCQWGSISVAALVPEIACRIFVRKKKYQPSLALPSNVV